MSHKKEGDKGDAKSDEKLGAEVKQGAPAAEPKPATPAAAEAAGAHAAGGGQVLA